ncbi:uncharacterized protein ACO6RY_00612 [Pungitius sinensis]
MLVVIEGEPTITKVTRVIDGQPSITKVTRVIEGQPSITKVTRVIEGQPSITKVTRVIEGQPSITKVTRVIEGQPSITKVTRVVEGPQFSVSSGTANIALEETDISSMDDDSKRLVQIIKEGSSRRTASRRVVDSNRRRGRD